MYSGGQVSFQSGWKDGATVFDTPQLSAVYDEAEISVNAPLFIIVPEEFFDASRAAEALASAVRLPEGADVEYAEIPEYKAFMVYSLPCGENISGVIATSVSLKDAGPVKVMPEAWYVVRDLSAIDQYNKISASYIEGKLYLAVAQGDDLLLCNVFDAPDFTTAQYYIFMVLNKLQINRVQSSVRFRSPLEEDWEISLGKYFKAVL